MDALEVMGADVRQVPAVPFTDPKNYNHQVLELGIPQRSCKEGKGGRELQLIS